jgi:regulatory protein
MRKPPAPRPPPDAATLHSAALTHLARYAATQAGLTRVLIRKIERWARTADLDPDSLLAATTQARAAIDPILARLTESGALSDEAFAQSRARSLARAGRSRRAIGAHLASRGVAGPLASAALPTRPDHEFAAALIHARKRRIGPWAKAAPTPEQQRRDLASFARAGFAQSVAVRALAMDMDAAEASIAAFRAEV